MPLADVTLTAPVERSAIATVPSSTARHGRTRSSAQAARASAPPPRRRMIA